MKYIYACRIPTVRCDGNDDRDIYIHIYVYITMTGYVELIDHTCTERNDEHSCGL